MYSAEKFMLLVWDLLLYARHSDAIDSSQYVDMQRLFVSLWPLPYELPYLVEYGL